MAGLTFTIHAIGVSSPAFNSLSELLAAAGSSPLAHLGTSADDEPPQLKLSASERRRTSSATRLILECIEQALRTSPFPKTSLRSVFATDEGMGEVSKRMFDALAGARDVSPTVFSNSVHSAPAGYYSIASSNECASTVVSYGLESFASGLLCAVTEATTFGCPVLFVTYDVAMPEPLHEHLPVSESTAVAWIISTSSPLNGMPALGAFTFKIEPSLLGVSDIPAWLPDVWKSNSSMHGFAALALIDAPVGMQYRMALGAQQIVLERIGCAV